MNQILKTVAYRFPLIGNFFSVFGVVPYQPLTFITWEQSVCVGTYNQLAMGQPVEESKDEIKRCAESVADCYGHGVWLNKHIDIGELFKVVVIAHAYATDYKEDQRLNFINKIPSSRYIL